MGNKSRKAHFKNKRRGDGAVSRPRSPTRATRSLKKRTPEGCHRRGDSGKRAGRYKAVLPKNADAGWVRDIYLPLEKKNRYLLGIPRRRRAKKTSQCNSKGEKRIMGRLNRSHKPGGRMTSRGRGEGKKESVTRIVLQG